MRNVFKWEKQQRDLRWRWCRISWAGSTCNSEPQHDTINNMIYVSSGYPDQLGNRHNLIRVLTAGAVGNPSTMLPPFWQWDTPTRLKEKCMSIPSLIAQTRIWLVAVKMFVCVMFVCVDMVKEFLIWKIISFIHRPYRWKLGQTCDPGDTHVIHVAWIAYL